MRGLRTSCAGAVPRVCLPMKCLICGLCQRILRDGNNYPIRWSARLIPAAALAMKKKDRTVVSTMGRIG